MPKLVAQGLVVVGGTPFPVQSPSPERPGQALWINVEHRDQSASLAHLTIFDVDNVGDRPFPFFNSLPDPLVEHGVPYQMWMGWEDEDMFQVFDGILHAKEVHSQLTQTTLTGIHDDFKMRKKGFSRSRINISVGELLQQLAGEFDQTLKVQPSVASDPVWTTPMEWTVQGLPIVETNWDLMKHYLEAYGLIACTTKKNVIEIRKDKSDGPLIELVWGGPEFIDFTARQQQKRDERSARRKGHAQENMPGKRWEHEEGRKVDGARSLRAIPHRTGKRVDEPHKSPFQKHSVRLLSRRLDVEAREWSFSIRLRPEMINLEQVSLTKAGPQLDGVWQTASVEHEIGRGVAATNVSCWRPI